MREVIIDTETTGLRHADGDRIIEIGCVELMNRTPTGRQFHSYCNPGKKAVNPEAFRVHGLDNKFLKDHPFFEDIASDFIEFIGDDPLVIHNASFDIGFINAELDLCELPTITHDRVIDTLTLARKRHPAGPNSLDALCKRYKIINIDREQHGAIKDSWLLANVYIELLNERQAPMRFEDKAENRLGVAKRAPAKQRPMVMGPVADLIIHDEFVKTIPNAIWLRYKS